MKLEEYERKNIRNRLQDMQLRLWRFRKTITFTTNWVRSMRAHEETRQLSADLDKVVELIESIRSRSVALISEIDAVEKLPPVEDDTTPFLHFSDATPFQRELMAKGKVFRTYVPADPTPPRAPRRRTDTPR